MDFGFDIVVTLTGVSLVFLILVLLMCIITLEGKFFDSLDAKKKAAAQAAKEAQTKSAPAAKPVQAAPAAAAAPAPAVEEGIPGEVVAAIAAAIAAMSGGKYTLRSVRRAGQSGHGTWGKAGVSDVTAPF